MRMTQKRMRDRQNATPGCLNAVAGYAYISPCPTPNANGGELGFDIRGEDIDGDAAAWSVGGDNRNGNTVAQQA
jgi:hypothetical protein